jgi:hypothetical protein
MFEVKVDGDDVFVGPPTRVTGAGHAEDRRTLAGDAG